MATCVVAVQRLQFFWCTVTLFLGWKTTVFHGAGKIYFDILQHSFDQTCLKLMLLTNDNPTAFLFFSLAMMVVPFFRRVGDFSEICLHAHMSPFT